MECTQDYNFFFSDFWKFCRSLDVLNLRYMYEKVPEEHVLRLHMQHILNQLQLKTNDFKMY